MGLDLILILLLLICSITDILWRKIYNLVLFPAVILAFVLHFLEGGMIQLGYSLLGCAAGFSILIIPYMLGGMGAGDVKLLAVIGSLKGTVFIAVTADYMALIGALIALVILLLRGGLGVKIKRAAMLVGGLRMGFLLLVGLDRQSVSTGYPYGVAITTGALASLLLKGLL